MRSVMGYAIALAMMGCAAQEVETSAEPDGIARALETDRAIDAVLLAGQSVARDADQRFQVVLSTLNQREDAAERLVARAEEQSIRTRLPYVILFAHVGLASRAPREFLLRLALEKPPVLPMSQTSPRPHGSVRENYDSVASEVERTLGQAFAAANALVARRDTAALSEVYATGDLDVAMVAAASASSSGLLDDPAIQQLRARGVKGTFQPLSQSMMTLPDVVFGPDVQQPVQGPQ